MYRCITKKLLCPKMLGPEMLVPKAVSKVPGPACPVYSEPIEK